MANREYTVDLCVIGAAGAGLITAVRAKEEGVGSVLVLEKMKNTGGCTRIAGDLFAINSPVQKRLGIIHDADEMYLKHMRMVQWECNSKLVRKWYDHIGDAAQWMEDHGIFFEEQATAFSGTDRVLINYAGRGNNMVNKLEEICLKEGIEILTSTPARHLIVENGVVTGVVAERDGEPLIVHAKAVVIATGSVSGNDALVDRLYPGKNYSQIKRMAGVAHNSGDGFLMAEEIGGKQGAMHLMLIGPHNHPLNMRVGNIMRRFMLIQVNKNGERFTNEDLQEEEDWGWMRAISQDQQPGKMCYPMMDASIYRRMKEHPKNYTSIEEIHGSMLTNNLLSQYGEDAVLAQRTDRLAWIGMLDKDFEEAIAGGKLKLCQTLEEAAAFIGCDVEALRTTIEEYNGYCAKGHDDDFCKNPEYLWPLTEPPYYVFEGQQGIDTCSGGIAIDHTLRVIDKQDKPIPGLYAAGVCTSGWTGPNRYGYFGTCQSVVLFSGWYAGEVIAKALTRA